MKLVALPPLFWLMLLLTSATLRAETPAHAARPESKKPSSKAAAKSWKKSMELGHAAAIAKHYREAKDYFTAALAEASDFGENDLRLAETSAELGNVYHRLKDSSAAEPFLQKAAQIYAKGSNRLDYAAALRDLATVQYELGNFETAEKNARRAQSLYETALGRDSSDVGLCVLQVAAIKNRQEKFSEAEPLYRQAVKIMQNQPRKVQMSQLDTSATSWRIDTQTSGPNYAATLHALLQFASFLYTQSRYTETGDTLQTALELIEKKDEQLNHFLPLVLSSFADLYGSTTNFAKAEPILLKILSLKEKELGQKHPEVLKVLTSLAYTYEREGKAADAEKAYLKVLKTKESAQNSDNSDTIGSVMNLARFYFEQHRYPESAPLYQRALAYEEKAHGTTIAEDPLLEKVIALSAELENKSELETSYKKRINLYQDTFGSSNKALIKPLEAYAQWLRKEKRDAEAAPLEVRARTIRDATVKK